MTVSDYLAGLMDPEPGLLMTRVKRGTPGVDEPSMVARHKVESVHQSEELPPHSYPAGSSDIPMARSSTPWQLESQTPAMTGQAALPDAAAQPARDDAQTMNNGAAQSREGSALGAPKAPAS